MNEKKVGGYLCILWPKRQSGHRDVHYSGLWIVCSSLKVEMLGFSNLGLRGFSKSSKTKEQLFETWFFSEPSFRIFSAIFLWIQVQVWRAWVCWIQGLRLEIWNGSFQFQSIQFPCKKIQFNRNEFFLVLLHQAYLIEPWKTPFINPPNSFKGHFGWPGYFSRKFHMFKAFAPLPPGITSYR